MHAADSLESRATGSQASDGRGVDQTPHPLPAGNASDWSREQWLTAAAVAAAGLIYTCGMAVADPDLWGHTLYGLRAIDQGVLTESHDPFSYTTPGARWVNHEWLTEYQFGWLWRNCGELGLWWWRNALVAVVFAVGLVAAARARANLAAVLMLFVFSAECLAGFCTFIRPQLATFALLAVSLWLLRSAWLGAGERRLWWLPLLTALWVNLHGGFLAGVAIQCLFAVAAAVRGVLQPEHRRAARQFALVAIASLAATFVTPYGWELHVMLWHHLAPAQAVREWQPLWGAPQAPMYYVPFVILVLAFAGSRRWRWIDLLVVAAVTHQAVSHIRHVALLAIALMVLAPEPLSDALQRMFRRLATRFQGTGHRGRRVAAAGACIALLLATHLPQTIRMGQHGLPPWAIATECSRDAPGVPLRAVSWLRQQHVSGNLVTAYSWGQYMLWHLFPETRVAFDGRYRTIYTPELEREFLAFRELDEKGPRRVPFLDDRGAEIAILPSQQPACRYLRSRADWVEVLADEQASLFLKRIPRFAAVLAQVERGAVHVPPPPLWARFPAAPATAADGGKTPRGLARPSHLRKLSPRVTAVIAR